MTGDESAQDDGSESAQDDGSESAWSLPVILSLSKDELVEGRRVDSVDSCELTWIIEVSCGQAGDW